MALPMPLPAPVTMATCPLSGCSVVGILGLPCTWQLKKSLVCQTPNAAPQPHPEARSDAGTEAGGRWLRGGCSVWCGTPPDRLRLMRTQKRDHRLGNRLGLLWEQRMPSLGEFDELDPVSERLP